MVIVMDMSTGKIENVLIEARPQAEFGAFDDEVLNAGWLPQPVARLETHTHGVDAIQSAMACQQIDAEEFLNNLYRHQE